MKRVDVTVTGEIKLIFDPESPEFKEAFDNYKAVIDKNGKEAPMLNYVAITGYEPPTDCFSGIYVDADYSDLDFFADYETT